MGVGQVQSPVPLPPLLYPDLELLLLDLLHNRYWGLHLSLLVPLQLNLVLVGGFIQHTLHPLDTLLLLSAVGPGTAGSVAADGSGSTQASRAAGSTASPTGPTYESSPALGTGSAPAPPASGASAPATRTSTGSSG